MFDVVIIGAGVTGGMLARALSRYRLSVCVVEKASDVACGASKANSGIIHGGYDPLPHTLKAKLNAAGVPLLYKAADELHVPYRRTGSLVCAFGAEEEKPLAALLARGKENGIPDLKLLSGDAARAIEPALSAEVTGALLVPSAGVICPYMLTIAAIGNAMDNGVALLRDFAVCGIDRDKDGFTVRAASGDTVRGRFVANCAGGFADRISEMAGDDSFTLLPRAGEYLLLDKTEGARVSHTIFQVPSAAGKGVLVTPTADGNLLVGPTADAVKTPESTETTPAGLQKVATLAKKSVPSLDLRQVITSFAGVRASEKSGDFIIKMSNTVAGLLQVAAIDSPGLTASAAIAEYAVELLGKAGLPLEDNPAYCGERADSFAFRHMSDEEKDAYIKAHPAYGRVICRCETVSEGEIRDAIRRNPKAVDTDGVKRRTRAGMGRCQGGFCLPYVRRLLAEENGVPCASVTKKGGESYLTVGKL